MAEEPLGGGGGNGGASGDGASSGDGSGIGGEGASGGRDTASGGIGSGEAPEGEAGSPSEAAGGADGAVREDCLGPVRFSDAALEDYVRSVMHVAHGEPLLAEDAAHLMKLEVGREVGPLDGLQCFTGLVSLSLFGAFSDLTPLAALTSLEELRLSGDHIQDLAPLAELQSLSSLSLVQTSIEDVTPIGDLPALTHLTLDQNAKLRSIAPLRGLDQLYELLVSDTAITTLDGLENSTNLRTLVARANNISDIGALSGLGLLETVYLEDNEVSDLTPLATLGASAIRRIYLTSNRITNVEPLGALLDLWSLDLGQNTITDVSALASLRGLKTLGLAENSITDVSALRSLIRLIALDLRENNVSDIAAVYEMPALEDLALNDNPVSDLSPLVRSRLLSWLNISNTQVADVSPLSQLPLLSGLGASDVHTLRLSTLSSNTLDGLYLSEHPIDDPAFLARLPNLTSLTIESCGITDPRPLLSHLSGTLQFLNLRYNEIADLAQVSGIAARTIDLSYNPIDNLASLPLLSPFTESLVLIGTSVPCSSFSMVPERDPPVALSSDCGAP